MIREGKEPSESAAELPTTESEARASGASLEGRKKKRKRVRVKTAVGSGSRIRIRSRVLLPLGAILAAFLVGMLLVYPHIAGPGDGKVVELSLNAGGASSLADQLASAGVVGSPRLYALYLHLTRVDTNAIGGSHLVTDDVSPAELSARLERRGGAQRVKVTFPEGYTRFDMARRLATLHVCTEKGFLRAAEDPQLLRQFAIEGDSADGFLFPATYELAEDSDPRDIVIRLLTEFEKRFQQIVQIHQLGKADLEQSLGWQRQDIVTLASIIEKEAAVDDERPIIASVFLNRLRDPSFKRKVLQSDPTSAYGCLVMKEQIKACAGFNGKITHELNMDPSNVYSTYIREKLPPGPICNPGAKSLEAVVAPASTKYLYFVARGEGRHAFSETYEAHTNAVKKTSP